MRERYGTIQWYKVTQREMQACTLNVWYRVGSAGFDAVRLCIVAYTVNRAYRVQFPSLAIKCGLSCKWKCFSVELAAEACTNHMYSDLGGSKSGREEARKLGAYSGAKCSIVECWFPGTANFYVKCICKQIIEYSWICVLIRELGYTNPRLFPPSEKKVTNSTLATGANSQQRSSAADAFITRVLNRLSSYSLSADVLCADWSLTKNKLSRQFYWKTL
jgi:hypothetical protein